MLFNFSTEYILVVIMYSITSKKKNNTPIRANLTIFIAKNNSCDNVVIFWTIFSNDLMS